MPLQDANPTPSFGGFGLRLLLLSDGESVSFSDDVVWSLVSVLNPLVLGGTGAFLWKSARRR